MIGQTIRDLREKRGDSLRDLAKKIDRSHGTLGKIERGEVRPSVEVLRKIADIYEIPLSYLLEEEDTNRDLREFGIEWIRFAEEVQEKKLTLDELRAAVQMIDKIKNTKIDTDKQN